LTLIICIDSEIDIKADKSLKLSFSCNLIMTAEDSIKKFYENAEVFITGGSGFIGKVLVEKLLRSCDGLKKIYLLMRPKRGIKPSERIEKIFESSVRKFFF
jgi:FlaA1/EpsC-like NDP-sugar epimerase